jgi:hypothetical protein
MSATVNGVPTTYTMDIVSGLSQVLDDGTNTYLYGNGRIAQQSGLDAEYFLGDALGSVRQLADANGAITLARNYDPYGDTGNSLGSGVTGYGFTNIIQMMLLVFFKTWLLNGNYGLIGIGSDLWGKAQPNKDISRPHWVVVTGISSQWETPWHESNRSDWISPWKWVRVFNPYNDLSEYYPWRFFRPAHENFLFSMEVIIKR